MTICVLETQVLLASIFFVTYSLLLPPAFIVFHLMLDLPSKQWLEFSAN